MVKMVLDLLVAGWMLLLRAKSGNITYDNTLKHLALKLKSNPLNYAVWLPVEGLQGIRHLGIAVE